MKCDKPCLWRIPERYPASVIGVFRSAEAMDRFTLKRGQFLEKFAGIPVIDFGVSLRVLRKFDCLVSSAMVPIVGPTLARILAKFASENVQLIPARVIGSDGEAVEFAVLNVVGTVQCIDHARSSYEVLPGSNQILSFRKLEFVEGCLGARHISRDCEYLSHIVVSERLVTEVRSLGLAGVDFMEPINVRW